MAAAETFAALTATWRALLAAALLLLVGPVFLLVGASSWVVLIICIAWEKNHVHTFSVRCYNCKSADMFCHTVNFPCSKQVSR